MSRINDLRSQATAEVERIHRVYEAIGGNEDRAIEAIADLRAYCGQRWPLMLEEALRRYNRDRRGDK